MAPINNNLNSGLNSQSNDSSQVWTDLKEQGEDFVKKHTLIGWQSEYVSSAEPFAEKSKQFIASVMMHTPLALLGGCGTTWKVVDVDGDGFNPATGDCWESEFPVELDGVTYDFTSADVNPAAEETWYDGFDQNCDKQSDYDADGDGFTPDEYDGFTAANVVDGSDVLPAGDCDDTSAEISPMATEVCDGIDNDCDGDVDVNAVDAYQFYQDSDGDGYGDIITYVYACEAPEGYVENSDDCDDTDANTNPDKVWYADTDGDGYGDVSDVQMSCTRPSGYVENADDCDDTDYTINPGATEVCNGYDDNCDSLVDEDDPGLDTSTLTTWAPDADSDGYGNPDTTTHIESCFAPDASYLDTSLYDITDCDDENSDANPGFPVEYCNGYDDDCDGLVDTDDTDNLDTTTIPTYYLDSDSDGYGDNASYIDGQCSPPSGFVLDNSDCDDSNAAINPGETEVCDASDVDENCNGLSDDADSGVDASTYSTFYTDSDSDGYGDLSASLQACNQPSGAVTDATDCDDTTATINPAATEVCNGVDDDCDSLIDDDDSSLDVTSTTTFYSDSDSDGYGDSAASVQACAQPSGTVTDNTDCDDSNASVNPGETEVCDASNTDEDCDGLSDDQDSSVDVSGYTTYYVDSDGDGYGSSATVAACDLPSGAATGNGDCDDTNAAINPVAQEVCDASDTDEDCDGVSDDADSSVLASTKSTYYVDLDGDGYGDSSTSVQACDESSGYTDNTEDCDDTDANVWSTKEESFNGYDDNCDGITDYDVSYTTAEGVWYGEDASAQAGFEIAGGGDLNNDGLNDFVVGAPGEDGTGAAYIVDYSSGTSSLGSEIKISGTYTGAETGEALAYGDPNNDGFVDLLIGSPDDSSNYGVVYLFDGPVTASTSVSAASAAIIGSGNGAYAGEQVRSGCDVTGDGIEDVLIGEPAANKSYVVNGPVSSSFSLGSTTAFAVYTGENASDYTGYVRCLGDVNADGTDDYGVGGWGVDYGGTLSGSQYWFYGPISSGLQSVGTSDVRIDGESAGDNFGSSGGFGVGDVNNDGYDDVIVDAIGDDEAASAAGAAYLFYGNTSYSGTISASAYDAKFLGEATNNNAGTRAGIVGDINNDNHDDIVITAYNYGSVSGAVYALYGTSSLSGSVSLTNSEVQFTGDVSLDRFGRSAAQVGDVDGDGYDDIVTGASGYDQTTSDQGAAFLFMGF